jgi:hypothetical protein
MALEVPVHWVSGARGVNGWPVRPLQSCRAPAGGGGGLAKEISSLGCSSVRIFLPPESPSRKFSFASPHFLKKLSQFRIRIFSTGGGLFIGAQTDVWQTAPHAVV